eukprot:TRINITY_DN83018_c0_g1_i1.p1 TRINITY_DN83018_c0_g1~~TRINITY_DN83018_c0_g1_i1.p1  ORF type:complete len:467 (+),score=64.45 TRINITY_DN83018_c0_g1_i1:63-1403(+)
MAPSVQQGPPRAPAASARATAAVSCMLGSGIAVLLGGWVYVMLWPEASSFTKGLMYSVSTFVPPPSARTPLHVPPQGQPAYSEGAAAAPGASSLAEPIVTGVVCAALAARALARKSAKAKGRCGGSTRVCAVETSEPEVDEAAPKVAVAAGGGGAAAVQVEAEDGRLAESLDVAVRRMWTRADYLHIHTISGVLHTVIGTVYLIDIVLGDLVGFMGGAWTPHVPFSLVLASMLFGFINAVSGLQVTLLPRPFKTVEQLFGFGPDPNLKSAGFINTALFYCYLSYQSLRVIEGYPESLQWLDPIMGGTSLLALAHAVYIIFAWVGMGKLSQGLAWGMTLPLLLNLPVGLHLFLEGQSWVQAMTTGYPGWPELFFSANYAIAWAGSMVTVTLSFYERKVIDINARLWIILFIGLLNLMAVVAQGWTLVPEFFSGNGWFTLLTLIPQAH